MRGGIRCTARTGAAAVTYGCAAMRSRAAAARVATAAESAAMASAESATCVATATAAVLGESWMRRECESGSESKRGNEPPSRGEDSRARRRRLARMRVSRVG